MNLSGLCLKSRKEKKFGKFTVNILKVVFRKVPCLVLFHVTFYSLFLFNRGFLVPIGGYKFLRRPYLHTKLFLISIQFLCRSPVRYLSLVSLLFDRCKCSFRAVAFHIFSLLFRCFVNRVVSPIRFSTTHNFDVVLMMCISRKLRRRPRVFCLRLIWCVSVEFRQK